MALAVVALSTFFTPMSKNGKEYISLSICTNGIASILDGDVTTSRPATTTLARRDLGINFGIASVSSCPPHHSPS